VDDIEGENRSTLRKSEVLGRQPLPLLLYWTRLAVRGCRRSAWSTPRPAVMSTLAERHFIYEYGLR